MEKTNSDDWFNKSIGLISIIFTAIGIIGITITPQNANFIILGIAMIILVN